MKALVVTEKSSPSGLQRDGGARVIDTLKRMIGKNLTIMQFGPTTDESALTFNYPFNDPNRFNRRIANSTFIGKKVQEVQNSFTHVIFIHVSMQFGLIKYPLRKGITIWTFPMFLTPSYRISGEQIPSSYFEYEKQALSHSNYILTPSHLEKNQLVTIYNIHDSKIFLVPRGIETDYLFPQKRSIISSIRCCSIGSIKPQKNTLELIHLFKKISTRYPNATLDIIGPVQDEAYSIEVKRAIQELHLKDIVFLKGHIPPQQLGAELKGVHLHFSTAMCETFGRSIFETLASGIPNIVLKKENAAAEFLEHLPYIQFVKTQDEALKKLEIFISNYPILSEMALEVGKLYDDKLLSCLLNAVICEKPYLGICDYDGTLFHKNDPDRTLRSIKAFKRYSKRVICTARSPDDILKKIACYGLKVDWIIGSSGAIVTDGNGNTLWTRPLTRKDLLKATQKGRECSIHAGKTLQLFGPVEEIPEILGLRREVYQGIAFINNWRATKLHAVHQLLRKIKWKGRVRVFGDSLYDQELITFFGGTLITDNPKKFGQHKEVYYV